MTTKILALTDALGNLVRFVLLPGHRFDTVGVPPLIGSHSLDALIADNGLRQQQHHRRPERERGVKTVISQHPRQADRANRNKEALVNHYDNDKRSPSTLKANRTSWEMTGLSNQSTNALEIVDHDRQWADAYESERTRLVNAVGNAFVHFEHIGSTAIHGLAAKPIIDMMVAVSDLTKAMDLVPLMESIGYRVTETGMRDRLFLQRKTAGRLGYNLHIVESTTWQDRKERHLRDYLIANPGEAAAYGALKARLAKEYGGDGLAYTKAKTAFIQRATDALRDQKGLPRIDVWED